MHAAGGFCGTNGPPRTSLVNLLCQWFGNGTIRIECQWNAQQVAVGFETSAIDIHEDRIGNSRRRLFAVLRSHHRSKLKAFTNGRDDHVSIRFQLDRDFCFEPNDAIAEVLRSRAAREIGLRTGPTINKHLHSVDVEPVGTLNAHFQFHSAVGGYKVFAGSNRTVRPRRAP